MIQSQKINYQDDGVDFIGVYATDDKATQKKPVILVVHDWSGRNEFAEKKAQKLAELGYIGFAIDMYGQGQQGKTKEEKSALIQPLLADRTVLRSRMLAAVAAAKRIPGVDATKVGAIGFCFGGLCVLDLARSGEAVQGVVSFHGLLNAPANVAAKKIQAKILAIHGHDDPMVPPEQVLAFETEMTQARVDWQLHVYGGTMHAFMNPLANDPGFGTVYNDVAERRAWGTMKGFFEEVM